MDTLSYCIEKANELEANNIVPFTISDDGFFKSTQLYPRLVLEVESNKNNTKIPRACGDTILSLYSTNGDFSVIFPYFKLDSVDKKLNMFEAGLPIVGQYWPSFRVECESDVNVYVVYEIYANSYRLKLSHHHDSIYNDAKYLYLSGAGCKLHDSVTDREYIIVGKNDIGFSHNTVIPINTIKVV